MNFWRQGWPMLSVSYSTTYRNHVYMVLENLPYPCGQRATQVDGELKEHRGLDAINGESQIPCPQIIPGFL